MAQPLTNAEAAQIQDDLWNYLTQDLGVPLGARRPRASGEKSLTDGQRAFVAALGLQRLMTLLHRSPPAPGVQPCPITARFPEQLHGTLAHLPEAIMSVRDILDRGGPHVTASKMWRLLFFTWLGAGGHRGQPWDRLKRHPEVAKYNAERPEQAWEVLRWVMMQVQAEDCSLMRVVSGDGLDKKCRLSSKTFVMLVAWHGAVPSMLAGYRAGPRAFLAAMDQVMGMKGELFQKELCSYLASSTHKVLRAFGEDSMPFGQGAKNGAHAYLGITENHLASVKKLLPRLEAGMREIFPRLTRRQAALTVGDVEICLCFTTNYSRLARGLRKALGGVPYRTAMGSDPGGTAQLAREAIKTPAGWFAYENGRVLEKYEVSLPILPYGRFAVRSSPPGAARADRARLASFWGLGPLARNFRAARKRRLELKQAAQERAARGEAPRGRGRRLKTARCVSPPPSRKRAARCASPPRTPTKKRAAPKEEWRTPSKRRSSAAWA